MSALPSPTKIAGTHVSLYEAYYQLVDPDNYGQIGASEAAKFLKKSHLSDVILSKIWDISDPHSRGFLDKSGMFVAMKLCALAQQGQSLNHSNLYLDIAPPKMGDVVATKVVPCSQSSNSLVNKSCWSVSSVERTKYQQLFRSLEPINGCIPGNKVKSVLMDSKLPLETLGKIWDLADMDKDGRLNEHEFIVAMHLVYKALENNKIPNVLPVELKSNNIMNSEPSSKTTIINFSKESSDGLEKEKKIDDWIISYEDLKAAEKLFYQADEDMDGFVSGTEIKDIFIQSGLSQTVLAEIWNLCDLSQNGKLNKEQFALSMWLIKQKLNGIDLPRKLSLDMIPPSFRNKNSDCSISENENISNYSNPELDMINKEIIQVIRDKHVMEQDISQKEADIRVKTGEIKSLQSEFDTLAATLRQLDNQKGEAQKRLHDLKVQVDKLRQQALNQESTLEIQEDELNNKRQEIECLKSAEQNLEKQQQEYKEKLNLFSKQSQNIQFEISQTKANLTQLEEQQRQIFDIVTHYDAAIIAKDASIVPDISLSFKFEEEEHTYNLNSLNDFKNIKDKIRDNNQDLFNNNEDLHHQDYFESLQKNARHLENDPFQEKVEPSKDNKLFPVDPFSANNKSTSDPFFDKTKSKSDVSNEALIKDPFGEDPFAALHAPIRSESPSPALPPKKSKQPPPRPAPPRPSHGPTLLRTSTSPTSATISSSSDPFDERSTSTNTTNDTFGFADFTNFDSKPITAFGDAKSSALDHKVSSSIFETLADFGEDPFQNYQYEDLSTLSNTLYDNFENFTHETIVNNDDAVKVVAKKKETGC